MSSAIGPQDPILKAIQETHKEIEEARRLIRCREDGPFTMMCQLDVIADRLDGIETEIDLIHNNEKDMAMLVARMRQQRDEAIRQKRIIARYLKKQLRPPDPLA
jgi:hypothetical protein